MSEETTYRPKLRPLGQIDDPDTRATLVRIRRRGLSYKACAGAIGRSTQTLKNWRDADPTLQAEMDQAFSEHLEQHGATVADTKDARVSLEVLKLQDESYRPAVSSQVAIVLHLPSLLPESALTVDYSLLDEAAKAGALPEST